MIQEVLKTIPSHMVHQLGLVTFYVYGKKRQINNLLDFLQHQSQEILYERWRRVYSGSGKTYSR